MEFISSFPSTPLSYAIELTLECNNSCPGCANALGSGKHKTLHEWKLLLDKIAPPKDRTKYAELIRFTGGEPTLHRDFFQVIEYVDTFAIPHVTFTNGRWRDMKKIIDVFKNCHNFMGLLISLHGSTASMHNAFAGSDGASFDETCSNIRRAADAGLNVFTNTVLTKYNCKHIEKIIQFSQQLGAHHVVFNRYLGAPSPIEPSEERLVQAIRLIESLQERDSVCHLGNCVPPCFIENTSLGANEGFEACIISPDGGVRPDSLTRFSFGNIFEQTIEGIWKSDKALWFRCQVPEECMKCAALSRCRGGCKAVNVEHGFSADRLMKGAISEQTIEPMELHPDWKPIPYFTIRKEVFGYLVCRVNWSIPFKHEAKSLLDAINGDISLAQIYEQFSDEGLELVGRLYKEGCIDFE